MLHLVFHATHYTTSQTTAHQLLANENLDGSLAERRTRRENRQLPKRYRDVLTGPPPPLPPTSPHMPAEATDAESITSPAPTVIPLPSLDFSAMSQGGGSLKSTRNEFGLFQQYDATRFPEHNPDGNLTCGNIKDYPAEGSLTCPINYYPYANESSFLLGEWYWNDGVKKSQSSFQNLIKIVGHPNFRPEDVAGQNWQKINRQLRGDHESLSTEEGDWEDAEGSGDWIQTPIKIQVPFHKTMLHPGAKEFEAGILHHRKLVSVIREKLTRPSTHPHLHFEPYKTFWQPNEHTEPVRVYGELYTSEAFVEAPRQLQGSPGEPGCDLPRLVAGLMFASDGTHLTTFSNNKLWPVYLAIGNESKYRRSKPSCEAFEHIAYFETVGCYSSTLTFI